ncbi:MAG: hypothetical protein Kow00111_26020 [Thermincola ferriacetica]
MVATEIMEIDVGGRFFKVKAVKDIDSLLNLVKTDDDVPFWAVLWPAAIGMARFLWQGPDLTGQKILELGAGLGLAGIVAAAKNGVVYQTDLFPEALDFCAFNAKLNKVGNIKRIQADWRSFEITEDFDIILGSDILYEPTLHPYLKSIFYRLLKPGGRIILSDPGRKDAQEFICGLGQEEFGVAECRFNVEDSGLHYRVTVYTLELG